MPLPYTPATPDRQVVRLRVMDAQVDLTRWTSYRFGTHLLRPTEGWSCTVADGELAAEQADALQVGARVRLYVDQAPLAEGYMDGIEISASRGAGVAYQVHGRNRLGLAVDAIADPTLQFKQGASLLAVLKGIFGPFGWANDDDFTVDNAVNRNAKTGGIRGTPTTKGGKKKGPRPLKDFINHQLKPHNHEGVYAFAARITERHGLRIWCSADGEKLIVSTPDYEQEPRYQIRRDRTGGTNVLEGTVNFDGSDQPSIIFADGFSGGGEFGKGRVKAFCVNPYFGVDKDGFVLDEVSRLISKYPDAQQVTMTVQPYRRRSLGVPMRPVFLHDDESKTQAEINNFVRREMSLLLRKSLVANYTVEGHGQNVEGVFTPWDIDTVVDVQDDLAGVNERMYVIGRVFEKSRQSGTVTHLELVRLNSLELGELTQPSKNDPKVH